MKQVRRKEKKPVRSKIAWFSSRNVMNHSIWNIDHLVFDIYVTRGSNQDEESCMLTDWLHCLRWMLDFGFESTILLTLLTFHGKITIMRSSVKKSKETMKSETSLVLLSKYLDVFPYLIKLRMDVGNLTKIVFITHLLLMDLLFKSLPLHCPWDAIWSHQRTYVIWYPLLLQQLLSLVSSFLTWGCE